jgi:hypothetical protein
MICRMVKIYRTSDACPTQWEGVNAEGYVIYIRYRGGFLSIRKGDRSRDVQSAVAGEEIFGKRVSDDPYDSCLSYEELRAVTAGLISFPPQETGRRERLYMISLDGDRTSTEIIGAPQELPDDDEDGVASS